MKRNNWSLLINPFTRLAGLDALITGLIIVSITVLIGYLSQVIYPATLDIKLANNVSLLAAATIQLATIASVVLVMYISTLFLAPATRFIDVLGTSTLARFPYLFASILGFCVENDHSLKLIEDLQSGQFDISNYWGLMIFSLITIPLIIWYVILLYNAYCISSGLKGPKAVISYIVIIIISEVLSMIFSYNLLTKVFS